MLNEKNIKTPRVYCVYAIIIVSLVMLALCIYSFVTNTDQFHTQITSGCIINVVLVVIAEYYKRRDIKDNTNPNT